MDIVVVDDEPLARDRLKRMLSTEADYRVVAEASTADEAIAAVMREDPDIVLLDIYMPGDSGLQAAESLSALEDPPAIIFCTAYDQHALDAFGVNAVDYLLKPVKKEKLMSALAKAQSLNKAQRQQIDKGREGDIRAHISARTRKGMELIPIEQIFYFSADQKYVTVFHQGGQTLIDDTLKELETEFAGRFVRIHRNALVALNRIEAMKKNSAGQFVLKLSDTDHQPVVSRRHVGGLKELMGRL